MAILIFLLLLASDVLADYYKKPVYEYKYETEDVMKTDATSIPVHGYHFVQEGYYPQQYGGYSGNLGGVGGPGFIGGGSGFIGGGSQFIEGPQLGRNYYPGIRQAGLIGGGNYPPLYHHYGAGGDFINKQVYSNGNSGLSGGKFGKAHGIKGSEFTKGQEGYSEGKVDLRDNKGDSGYYNEKGGEKKVYEDGKAYLGGQHFDQYGKSADEQKRKGFHKKGHVIKGFKKSHHKDEDGKTEEFYDEDHDEGDNYSYGGKSGSFGEKTESAYNGGHDNGHFNAAEKKKEGHYDNLHIIDNNNADKGHYGEKKYATANDAFGTHHGADEHSLLGHQEANKVYKHHPYHVPFYPSY